MYTYLILKSNKQYIFLTNSVYTYISNRYLRRIKQFFKTSCFCSESKICNNLYETIKYINNSIVLVFTIVTFIVILIT